MPDIDMCDNTKCDCRKYCHRFTALSSGEDQRYKHFDSLTDGSRCEGFWSNKQCLSTNKRVQGYPGMTPAEEGIAT